MTGKKSKIGAMVVAAAASLTLGVGVAHSAHASGSTPFAADTDDNLSPASTAVTGTSHKTVFSVAAGAIVVTCTLSKAKATTPATGLGPVNLTSPPTFTDGGTAPCTDNLGGTDTTATNGTWTLKFVDAPNDETGTEPNATGDKMQIVVPQNGAVVTNSLGCTITVAPNGPFTVTGKYDDTSKLHVNISNLPISVAGGPQCPTNATSSTFAGTYTFSPGVHDAS